MENLFYSENEKIAFYIAGYTDNSLLVEDIISMLTKHTEKFSEKVCVDPKVVKTDYIVNSSRYKEMRVFYAEVEKKPKDAFVLTSKQGWTMHKWLHN